MLSFVPRVDAGFCTRVLDGRVYLVPEYTINTIAVQVYIYVWPVPGIVATNDLLGRVMFGVISGRKKPRPCRPENSWPRCLADDLQVL